MQINGATVEGGCGSNEGLAMEIPQAMVTVFAGVFIGNVQVVEGGILTVYEGIFRGEVNV